MTRKLAQNQRFARRWQRLASTFGPGCYPPAVRFLRGSAETDPLLRRLRRLHVRCAPANTASRHHRAADTLLRAADTLASGSYVWQCRLRPPPELRRRATRHAIRPPVRRLKVGLGPKRRGKPQPGQISHAQTQARPRRCAAFAPHTFKIVQSWLVLGQGQQSAPRRVVIFRPQFAQPEMRRQELTQPGFWHPMYQVWVQFRTVLKLPQTENQATSLR